MPRHVNIKWRKQDYAALQKTVKNFNAKIARILKKNPDAAEYLPDKLSYAQLKKDIETRRDFNNVVKSLQRFSKKGAEAPIVNPQGVKTTKWEKREIGIRVGQINRQRAAHRRRLPISHEHGTMGTVVEHNLDKKEWDWRKKTHYAWEKFKESVFHQSQANYWSDKERLYLGNYYAAVDNNYGTIGLVLKVLAAKAGAYWMYYHYAEDQRLQIGFTYGASERYGKIGATLDAFALYGITLTDAEIERFRDDLTEVGGKSEYYSKKLGIVNWEEPVEDDMDDD